MTPGCSTLPRSRTSPGELRRRYEATLDAGSPSACSISATSSSSSSSSSTNFIATQVLKKTQGPLCVTCYTSVNATVAGGVRCRMIYGTVPSSARLNASIDGSDVIAGGSVFQTFAAATGKARSPMVLCNDRGTCSDSDDADRRRLRDSMSATRCSSLPR